MILLSRLSRWTKATCSSQHCHSTEAFLCDPVWGNRLKWIKIFYLVSQNLARRMSLEGIKITPMQTKMNLSHIISSCLSYSMVFKTKKKFQKVLFVFFKLLMSLLLYIFILGFTCWGPLVIFCQELNHFCFNSFSISPQQTHLEGTTESSITRKMKQGSESPLRI